jgi:hypothetical protein
MIRLALTLLAACGSAAELGTPNPPPEWPMGTDLHHPTPAVVEPVPAAADTDPVPTAPAEGSAAPATEVTEPPAPPREDVPVAPEPAEEP